MDQFEIAWLAGIVDGEGSFFCSLRPYNGSGERLEHVFAVGMTCLNTMKTIQRLVHEITGRKYKLRTFVHRAQHHKTCWSLSVSRKAALEKLIVALRPFLVTKRRQADLMLRLARHRQPHTGRGHPAQRPEWVHDCVTAIKALNRGGIPSEAGLVAGTCTDSTVVTCG